MTVSSFNDSEQAKVKLVEMKIKAADVFYPSELVGTREKGLLKASSSCGETQDY